MNEAQRIASEAQRLLNEPLLAEALSDIMGDAFADFKNMKITPDTIHEVIALQQRIKVVQAIPERLKVKILASGQSDGGVTVETTA